MVVTCSGIERAIQYFHAISAYLIERKSPYRAIVAFSGEHEYGGDARSPRRRSTASRRSEIADKIEKDPYRFLICADKFQTGYDEPLLHTMYVDKPLSGVKAVQTLSRLNRAHPQKHDVFVLDFMNDTETIRGGVRRPTTGRRSSATRPTRTSCTTSRPTSTAFEVYDATQVDEFVELYLAGADRDQLDPILDACVATYIEDLDEDGQVDFKGKAKAFARTYGFLASILPYTNADWEKLSIFLNFLIPKLPAPKEEDLSKGSSKRSTWTATASRSRRRMKIQLPDAGRRDRPGADRAAAAASRSRNSTGCPTSSRPSTTMFGNIEWADADRSSN